jgi:enoyl-CoA hydratase/carnithine racemase
MMITTTDVLFSEVEGQGGKLGIITLNRPSVLNSLNHDMVVAMDAQLRLWSEAQRIKAVVIKAAEGRAFCAGGDIRLTYERMRSKDPLMTEFFRDEYQLNRLIFHYPKPYIALLDGITMGGGVGVSIHGSHRVATERLLFAMPETGIGFFPDVGGTYFLPRLPHYIGMYLGLTGARINAADCVAAGIATHLVKQENLDQIIDALAQQDLSYHANAVVSDVLNRFHLSPQTSQLMTLAQEISQIFHADSMQKIMTNLQTNPSAFCQETMATLNKKSPTGLVVTLAALRQGAKMDFDDCMKQEFRLVTHFLLSHDFAEGIRAVIIDKDQSPQWQPKHITEIHENDLNTYFKPVLEELV